MSADLGAFADGSPCRVSAIARVEDAGRLAELVQRVWANRASATSGRTASSQKVRWTSRATG
jgi:hypothetical protein